MDASDPASFLVGIGFANVDRLFYVDVRGLEREVEDYLKDCIKQSELIAFNVLFDGAFLAAYTCEWNKWVGCAYGLYRALTSEGFPGQLWNLESAIDNVLGWPDNNKTSFFQLLKERGLTKATMWQMEPQHLGKYCALDTEAAWQLWHVMLEAIAGTQAEAWLPVHRNEWLTQVKILAEQQFWGIRINEEKLEAYRRELQSDIESLRQSFLTHPEIADHIIRFNTDVLGAWKASEPARLTKCGEVSKNWLKWVDRRDSFLQKKGFNPNSKPQLAWLYYGQLKREILARTDKGKPKVDKYVLPYLGESARVLIKYNMLVKRLGYVNAVARKVRDGVLHVEWNSFGTFTGRLANDKDAGEQTGKLNPLQMPKVRGFMECWECRPGHKLVQFDFAQIEPRVLTEASRDNMLWELYGPEANPNATVYLHTGALIDRLAPKVLEFYDPKNPTEESKKLFKKKYPTEYAVLKEVVLASNYNGGPETIHRALLIKAGLDISLSEVRQICKQYHRAYKQVGIFEERLWAMRSVTGGWIPSLRGLPMCMADSRQKDVKSQFCQGSAAQILWRLLYNIQKLRVERKVSMYPWIPNFHDETIWEVPDHEVERCKQILIDARDITNQEIGAVVQFMGEPEVGETLADIKVED